LDERAQKLLMQYGLTERESLVYLSLLSKGRQSAGEIAKAVEIRRMEAYRIIKRLADAGVVVAAPGNPVKYTAEPIEQVVAMMMDRQMKKLDEMEKGRAEVVSIGRSMAQVGETTKEEYSFRMVQGREQIYAQVLRMVAGASSSVEMVLTRNDLVQLHVMGLAETLKEAKKNGVRVRVISVCDGQTAEAVDALSKSSEVKHSDDFLKSRMVVIDKVQVLVSLVLDDVTGRKNDRDVAIWTNSGDYAGTMLPMFTKAFAAGSDAKERLHELKTGKKGEEKARAMIDILRASLPLEGWKVEAPARIKGVSGAGYDVSAKIEAGGKSYALEVVMGGSAESTRGNLIAAIMEGIDIKSPSLIVIGSPFTGDELDRLANLMGVVLIDGTDPVVAATKLRKEVGK